MASSLPALVQIVFTFLAYGYFPFFQALLLSAALDLVLRSFVVLLSLLLKACLVPGGLRAGTFAVYSAYYWKWWLVTRLQTTAVNEWSNLLMETPLMPVLYRLLGARIGSGCVLDGDISDPDLVTLGDGCVLSRASQIACHDIGNGEIRLAPVELGDKVCVGAEAFVTAGSVLPASTIVKPLSAAHSETAANTAANGPAQNGAGGAATWRCRDGDLELNAEQAHWARAELSPETVAGLTRAMLGKLLPGAARTAHLSGTQCALRIGLGIPLLIVLQEVVYYPVYVIMDELYQLNWGPVPMLVVLAWLMTFLYSECYFVLVVLCKRLILRLAHEGTVPTGELGRFRFWLLERMTSTQPFQDAMVRSRLALRSPTC